MATGDIIMMGTDTIPANHLECSGSILSKITYPNLYTSLCDGSTSCIYGEIDGYSGNFNGTNAYLSVPDSADWYFGTGDFTIDCWIYLIAQPAANINVDIASQRVDDNNAWSFHYGDGAGTKYLVFSSNSGGSVMVNAYIVQSLSLNTWYHLAVVRNVSQYYIFLNGVSLTLTGGTSSNAIPDLAAVLQIGRFGTTWYLNAYIEEFRVSKGIARWTSGFIPSSSEYTSDSYTKLLLHLNNNVTDSGSVGYTVTNNNMTYSATSPFGKWSGSFNGSSSYITTPDSADWNFSTGDLTIDLWIYLNSLPSSGVQYGICEQYVDANNGWGIGIVNDGTGYWLNFYERTTASGWHILFQRQVSLAISTWYHLAISRNGSNFRWFLNGSQVGTTYVNSDSMSDFAAILSIGRVSMSGATYFPGRIEEFRISKGTARWTTTFTPSRTPLVSDSYTKLLLHFNNNFKDSSSNNYVITNSSTTFSNSSPLTNTNGFFYIPDLRGRFVRGWDHARGKDPDKAARTAINTGGNTGDNVGSVQGTQYESHLHSYSNIFGSANWTSGSHHSSRRPSGTNYAINLYNENSSTETRPINRNVMYCIEY